MLGWESQGNNYALRQYDADGNNKRVPVIASSATEWAVVPQKSLILLSLILNPPPGTTATVDLCFDHMADVNQQLNPSFSGTNTLIWVPSGLGNVTSASADDKKQLYLLANVSAFRVSATGGVLPIRATV